MTGALDFRLHPRLQQDCLRLGRLDLSQLLLQRNATVPWFILVPEVEATELHRMAREQRQHLMDEMAALAEAVEGLFACDKINVAAIGNLVPQLHCHVIARRRDDACWPGVVWGRLPEGETWSDAEQERVAAGLQRAIGLQRLVTDLAVRPLPWRAIDDVVMGGRSHSAMAPTEAGGARFHGYLSLQGGGFASVRCDLPLAQDHGAASAFHLRLRGDGKRYRLSLRSDAAAEGLVYQAAFDSVAGGWQTVELPLADFRASYHGRPVEGAPPFRPQALHSIGLVIADRQEGDFALEVDEITTR